MLKTATVEVAGEQIEITELNALAQIEVIEARRAFGDDPPATVNMRLAAIMCAHCVPAWEGSPEAVLKSHTLSTVLEVAGRITELSGSDAAKNSESAPSDDSSSG